jgi:hypothetical protein
MSLRSEKSVVVVVGLLVALAGGVFWGIQHGPQVSAGPQAKNSAAADDEKDKPVLADFMRQKMDASHDIMDGLLMEDSRSIVKAARKLKDMSDTERWRVSNDIMYRNHSEDFRRSVDKLIAASKGNSIDRAALSWFDVTLSCIDCHRYVRTVLIADSDTEHMLPGKR